MDVRCPQCQTLYELEDGQVGGRSVTLKCSQCQHVFLLDSSSAIGENVRRWMIRRKKEGDILYLNTFDTLHERILKRECGRHDEISRTGGSWVELGEVPEFGPMFQVVDSISQMGGSSAVSSIATQLEPSSPGVPAPTPPRAGPRERVRTEVQFPSPSKSQRTEDITKRVGPTGPPPPEVEADDPFEEVPPEPTLGEESSWAMDAPAESAAEGPLLAERSGRGGGIIAGILVLGGLAGGGAYVLTSTPATSNKSQVVSLGETNGALAKKERSPIDPQEEVAGAVAEAMKAAHAENDAIWTLWHATASTPFYVALDTAYAAADNASVSVELDVMIAEARSALENGRTADANRKFREILAKEPGNAEAISGLGWTLLAQQQSQEAARHFSDAIDKNPNVGDAYIGLGTAHRQLGDPQKAFNAYDRYLGRFPRGPKASIAQYQMEQLKRQIGSP